jgi:hypothetical protein
MTQIDAINRMLRYIGELPIPSDIVLDDLEEGHEALQARVILNETLREEQEEKYWFNKQTISFIPDTSGYITIPYNIISLQGSSSTNYVMEGGTLYDVDNETKIFTENVELDVLLEVQFDDVPDVFRTYVVLVAAKHLHTYLNGDDSTQAELKDKIQLQRIKLEKENLRQSKFNLVRGTRLSDRGSNPSALV